MNTLLTNCRIVNPFSIPEFIENGFIFIESGIIAEIGEGIPDFTVDEKHDLHGKTVLPGMINAHAHLYSTLAMGMPFPKGNPKNFTEILEQVWWILDRTLDQKSTKASFEAGLLDHLRHGVTTVIDHHSSQNYIDGSLNMLAEIAKQFGINISGAFEMTARNGKQIFRDSLDENVIFHQRYLKSDTVRPLIGLHASFTLSDESLRAVSDRLKSERNWGIHIHVAEDKADQIDAKSRGYDSVIQRLDSFGLLNENSLVIHGVHFEPGDADILKQTGAMLVHNPSSNANNRVGMTPTALIEEMQAGLGTDGMQGNMLGEAKEGTLIRNSHLAGGESSVNYAEMLFKHNADITTKLFRRKIGKLDPSYIADLAIFDYHPRTEFNADNWIGHALFGMESPSDVMTNGIFRIRNNSLIDLDEKAIVNNAKHQAGSLWNAMENILD